MKPSFVIFLFAAMAVAQRQSPQSSTRVQKAAKTTENRVQQFRYRMASSEQGSYVAGFAKIHVSGESAGTAENPRREPKAINKNARIMLERGVITTDPSFADWINRSRKAQTRDLVIDSFNEAGQKSSSMYLSRCVVEEYHAANDLEGAARSAKIQLMTLHCAAVRRSTP